MEDDWAARVADTIMGDIPRSLHADWAEDLPARVAAMLRREAAAGASGPTAPERIGDVMAALPHYLSAQTAARTRAKLIGAALVARALGDDWRTAARPAAPVFGPDRRPDAPGTDKE